jgi:antitoxin (DNA-binding transcriptional repressor) of toxin-antitoxin stability system
MTVTVEQAQRTLPDLIIRAAAGEDVVISRGETAIAKLVAAQPRAMEPRVPGSARGILTILSEDDDHLKDFAEYMP